jgi:ABC-2 type transport system ATP-binding protein
MIQAKELSKRYGGTLAVDGLTFDVRPGRVTGFLGPNGSGKSTTLRMALGLDLPTAGSVTVNGCPYRRLPRPLYEVGALLDANAVHGGRSAYDHLLALAQSNRIGRRRVGEVLDLVGLAAVAGQRVGGFSLGMRQRLGIAAALLGDPGVLMLDEPVNGLDPEGIRWIRGLLRSLAAEGRTVFVSSHLMSEMAQTADHLVVIGKGRLIADRSLAEFIQGTGTGQVLVRTPDPDRLAAALGAEATVTREADGALLVAGLTAARVGEAAAAAGVVLHELSPRTSLEEAFMELTADAVEYTSTGGTR